MLFAMLAHTAGPQHVRLPWCLLDRGLATGPTLLGGRTDFARPPAVKRLEPGPTWLDRGS